MNKLIKICFFNILMAMKSFSAESLYERSDLALSSQNFRVLFFNDQNTRVTVSINDQATYEGYYVTAIACSTMEKVGDLTFQKFKDGPLHYLCLAEEEKYKDLHEKLDYMNSAFHQVCDDDFSHLRSNPTICPQSSLESLYSSIQDSETVIFTFGAGISYGYVPTLIEFFKTLNLEKVASDDSATDASMAQYIRKLFTDPENTLEQARAEWLKVTFCRLKTTPAHQSMQSLIELLKKAGKDIFVYTDNIDGIHHRSNIKLSETHLPEDGLTIIDYPAAEKINNKKVTVLVCGQSFDFHGILSTIQTRGRHAKELSFFSLNVSPNSIAIYDGLDVGDYSSDEDQDTPLPSLKYLDMAHIPGSLHQTLPELYSMFLS